MLNRCRRFAVVVMTYRTVSRVNLVKVGCFQGTLSVFVVTGRHFDDTFRRRYAY